MSVKNYIDNKVIGGVLIKSLKTNKVFLVYRNDKTPIWSLVSGTINKGESVLDGLKREINEELSINPDIITFKFNKIEIFLDKKHEFHYYEGFVDNEFNPILDEENITSTWITLDSVPSPLFSGLLEKIKIIL